MIEWAYILSFLLMSLLVWIAAYNTGYGDGLAWTADEIKKVRKGEEMRWYSEYNKLNDEKWSALNRENIHSTLNSKYKQKLEKIKDIINFIKTIPNCDCAYYCEDKLDEILGIIEGERNDIDELLERVL